jgi:ADP-ribosyl-[dinitrogen reductase] hydrolase
MFFFPDHRAAVRFSGESSRTTHGAAECVDACRLFGSMLFKALSGQPKEEILFGDPFPGWPEPPLADRIQALASGTYRGRSERDIRGSGYVVESLEAALWCFYCTDNFRDAILKAVNLGDDADTTGAVCGQIAGAYYGGGGIPQAWRDRLAMRDLIADLAEKLFHAKGGALS